MNLWDLSVRLSDAVRFMGRRLRASQFHMGGGGGVCRSLPLLVDALGGACRIRIAGHSFEECGDDRRERHIVVSGPEPGFEMRLSRDGEGDISRGHEDSFIASLSLCSEWGKLPAILR